MIDILMMNYGHFVYLFLGSFFTLAIGGVVFAIWHRRRLTNLRIDLMQRLPMTLEQIDADLELLKAHHMVDICKYELEIAKIKESEAEANARLSEARNRIDSLNRKLEIFKIQKSASKKIKQVRRIEEQLIDLDQASTPLDKKADKTLQKH